MRNGQKMKTPKNSFLYLGENLGDRVIIDGTIYFVVKRCGNEVCVLMTDDYEDGLKRQRIHWTEDYQIHK